MLIVFVVILYYAACFEFICYVVVSLYNFGETPRKFTIAKLSISKLGSSSVLIQLTDRELYDIA